MASETCAQSGHKIMAVRRFGTFAGIGAAVFVFGTVLQWILLRRISSDASYAWQTLASIELSYTLNRWLTWGDREVAIWVSWLRWNAQKLVLNIPNVLAYDVLVRAGLSWLAANVVVSVVFIAVNYFTGDLWSFAERMPWRKLPALVPALSFPERQRAGVGALMAVAATLPQEAVPEVAEPVPSRGQHRAPRRRLKLRPVATALLCLIVTAGGVGALVHYPAARWVIYTAWMMPVIELAMLCAGHLHYRRGFKVAPAGTFTHLILQITTTGAEQKRVNEIIEQIHSYRLPMSYEVWVVSEPGHANLYPRADKLLVVPPDFTCRAAHKARALEFSRRVRRDTGRARPDVKIIFNDDDVSLTRAYILRAFEADYDVCEGVVSPRTAYAARPFGHFVTSHADDIRTHACLAYCSVFQGILRRPIHAHGEGLVTTGHAEAVVGWDWPAFASEDLVFAQRAVRSRLRWGWFHEYAEITSPWSVRDFLVQRRRWLWGDIHAITRNGVMPLPGRILVLLKYLVGVTVLLASAAGLYLRATGRIPATAGALDWAKLSILSWLGFLFACGWIGAGTRQPARSADSRLLAGVCAVVMVPVSTLLTFAAIVIPLVEGKPASFDVIAKTRRDA
jgi:putative flippase GtrA